MRKFRVKNDARILVIDIETKPTTAYVWGLFDVNISIDQIISPSAPICFSAKFMGEPTTYFFSDWEHGHSNMIAAAHELISQADAVVTYNGDKFDLPKLRGEFLLEGLPPPPPVTSIDVYKAVRKLGFQSNRLAFIGPFLKVGEKVKNEGFSLWTKVMDGDTAAQSRMQKYCIGDTTLTEKVYALLRPYIVNHPHLGEAGAHTCGACGGSHLHKRGTRRTKAFAIQRLQCQDCGSWSDGPRKKVT
jgi:hypothetical protein